MRSKLIVLNVILMLISYTVRADDKNTKEAYLAALEDGLGISYELKFTVEIPLKDGDTCKLTYKSVSTPQVFKPDIVCANNEQKAGKAFLDDIYFTSRNAAFVELDRSFGGSDDDEVVLGANWDTSGCKSKSDLTVGQLKKALRFSFHTNKPPKGGEVDFIFGITGIKGDKTFYRNDLQKHLQVLPAPPQYGCSEAGEVIFPGNP